MTAIEIIRAAAQQWPITVPLQLSTSADDDLKYALTKPRGRVRDAILARAEAAERAVEAIGAGDFNHFKVDPSAGIITLNIACKLLQLDPAARTQAAVNMWGE